MRAVLSGWRLPQSGPITPPIIQRANHDEDRSECREFQTYTTLCRAARRHAGAFRVQLRQRGNQPLRERPGWRDPPRGDQQSVQSMQPLCGQEKSVQPLQPLRGQEDESVQPLQPLRGQEDESVQPLQSVCGQEDESVQPLQPLRGQEEEPLRGQLAPLRAAGLDTGPPRPTPQRENYPRYQ